MGQLTVSWTQPATFADGTPFANLGHFEVHLGTSPATYTIVHNAGTALSTVVPGLLTGQLYYIGVKAFDNLGNSSAFSTEISAVAVETMAIDTRDKRASCLMLALPFGRVFPVPDGSLNTGPDRTHMSYLYRGITAAAAALMALERGISRRIHGRIFGRVNRREPEPSRVGWRV
jgi:hypothetical protein